VQIISIWNAFATVTIGSFGSKSRISDVGTASLEVTSVDAPVLSRLSGPEKFISENHTSIVPQIAPIIWPKIMTRAIEA
jgi:hypothetical protein